MKNKVLLNKEKKKRKLELKKGEEHLILSLITMSHKTLEKHAPPKEIHVSQSQRSPTINENSSSRATCQPLRSPFFFSTLKSLDWDHRKIGDHHRPPQLGPTPYPASPIPTGPRSLRCLKKWAPPPPSSVAPTIHSPRFFILY